MGGLVCFFCFGGGGGGVGSFGSFVCPPPRGGGGGGGGGALLALSCEGGATWPTIFPFFFPKDFCEFLIYF